MIIAVANQKGGLLEKTYHGPRHWLQDWQRRGTGFWD